MNNARSEEDMVPLMLHGHQLLTAVDVENGAQRAADQDLARSSSRWRPPPNLAAVAFSSAA
jgi:hypothetical protein